MSNLSDLLPAGGAGKTVELVASGALSNGNKVILQSDGTVKVIEQTTIAESIPAGSTAVYNTAESSYNRASFDPNSSGKFVVVYRDHGNSSYGTAAIGTVTGTSISFGSEYVYSSSSMSAGNSTVAFDPNNAGKFVVAYCDGASQHYGNAKVGTVTGTTISFGSDNIWSGNNRAEWISISFSPNNTGKFVVAYKDDTASNAKMTVGTISGTSISYGSLVTFPNYSGTYGVGVACDPLTANQLVVTYMNQATGMYGTALVAHISGTSINLGTAVVFNSASTGTGDGSVAFDPNNAGKFVVAFYDGGNSYKGKVMVGTAAIVSGTAISTFGSEYTFSTGPLYQHPCVDFDPNGSGTFVVVYPNAGNSYKGTVRVSTITGTTISFGSETTISTINVSLMMVAFDPNGSGTFALTYAMWSQYHGTAVIGRVVSTTTNLTSTNFIGTSEGAFADTATATVMLRGGITTTQSGLTTGSKYYVQGDGTLSTTAGSPSVTAGKALSSTTLLIGGRS